MMGITRVTPVLNVRRALNSGCVFLFACLEDGWFLTRGSMEAMLLYFRLVWDKSKYLVANEMSKPESVLLR